MDNKPSTLSETRLVGPNGADDPRRLRAEIAETRNEMSETIEQLHGRLNPVVLKEQAIEQFHEATETIKKELKERLQEAKQNLLAELKDVKETVRVDVLEEIDTVKSKVSDEIGQAKAAIREATIGKVENMLHGAQTRVRNASRSAKDVVSDNPIPAALAGLGLAWLFIEGRRRRTSRLSEGRQPERRMLYGQGYDQDYYQDLEAERYSVGTVGEGGVQQQEGESIGRQIRDVGQSAGRKVAGATKEAASAVGQVAQRAKESVTEVAQRAQGKASELSRGAGQQARRVQRRSNELFRSNPIAVGAAMLAAGTIIGLAMPRTRVENELLGGARDRMLDKAEQVAHQAIGKAEEVVKRVGESEESQGQTSTGGAYSDDYH